jgi:hypothetical protein
MEAMIIVWCLPQRHEHRVPAKEWELNKQIWRCSTCGARKRELRPVVALRAKAASDVSSGACAAPPDESTTPS